jgi:hypothetical protein
LALKLADRFQAFSPPLSDFGAGAPFPAEPVPNPKVPGNDPTGVDFGGITAETKVYAFGGAK